jgi:hypothetical protein
MLITGKMLTSRIELSTALYILSYSAKAEPEGSGFTFDTLLKWRWRNRP